MVGLNVHVGTGQEIVFRFTFQYGGIKLTTTGDIIVNLLLFTFQYGGIKLGRAERQSHSSGDLHSSMVGLNINNKEDSMAEEIIYIPVWWD